MSNENQIGAQAMKTMDQVTERYGEGRATLRSIGVVLQVDVKDDQGNFERSETMWSFSDGTTSAEAVGMLTYAKRGMLG